MSVSRILQIAARWAGLAVLFVVTLEVCARVDDWLTWGAPLSGHYSQAVLMTTDDLGPHSRFGARFEKWRINSHGFRGPEITMAKPEGVVRILVVGASETFGLYESPGMEFPAQLQQKLDRAKPGRYQVLNSGCAGMTLPRFVHFYNVWLKKFEPDFVLCYPTPTSYVQRIVPGEPQPDEPPAKLRESIRLKRKTKIVVKRFLPPFLLQERHERRMEAWIQKQPPNWVWETLPPEKLALFETHLEQLVKTVRDSGVEMMLVTHAHRFPKDRSKWSAVDEAMMAAWRLVWARESERCKLDMEDEANRVIRELGERDGIPVADVAAAVPRTGENFADFSHFTDQGAGIVADLLARDILSREK